MSTVTIMTDDDALFDTLAQPLQDTPFQIKRLSQWRVECPESNTKGRQAQAILRETVWVFFRNFEIGDLLIVDWEENMFHPLGLWRNELLSNLYKTHTAECHDLARRLAIIAIVTPPKEVSLWTPGFWKPDADVLLVKEELSTDVIQRFVFRINDSLLNPEPD